jgi:hypothetical protein
VPTRRPADLRNGLQTALKAVTDAKIRAEVGKKFPIKQLRNQLIDAMSLHSILVPVLSDTYWTSPRGTKVLDPNPFWDTAPKGAFKKAKRLSGFVTHITTHYNGANILHDLERITTQVWKMPLRHLEGAMRTVKGKISLTSEKVKFLKSPEALAGSGTLTRNPGRKARVNRPTPGRKCRNNYGCAQMRLSTRVEIIREAYRCTVCAIRHVAG